MDGKIKVFIMDLLCITPFYDRYLFECLQKRIYEVTLGAISFHEDIGYFKRHGIRTNPGMMDIVSKLQIKNKIFRQILKAIEYMVNLFFISLRFWIRPPDIIYIHWVPLIRKLPFDAWFLRIMQTRGIKLVYMVHNVLPHDTGMKHKKAYRKIYHMVDFLTCHTEQVKKDLVEQFKISPEKVDVVPHGPMFHDTIKINYTEARKKLSYNDQVVILFFGLIRHYKGIEFLLQSWKKVVNVCPNAVLMLVGHGDDFYLNQLKIIIDELKIGCHVLNEFRYVSNEELVIFHQAADILVYPYKEISQSGALLTGMTFGKPIVATKVGGIKEILVNNETAVLVDYGDVNGFSEALVDLIKDPHKRSELGGKALDLVHSKYSWDVVARKTINSFYKLINKG